MRNYSLYRAVTVPLGTFCLTGFFLPLAAGIVNVGSLCLLAAATALLLTALFPQKCAFLWTRLGRACKIVSVTLLCAGVGLCALLSGKMLWAAADTPAEAGTVVVLGAGIHGDRPSRMLADRLRTAAEYLKAHPEAKCVTSGGQGEDELLSEATVMKCYLVELGIEETRIYEETASKNTEENLRYTRALIEREALPSFIIVVTQEFHQYRAGEYAARAGFTEASALSCASPWYLLPCYWVREWFAIVALWCT